MVSRLLENKPSDYLLLTLSSSKIKSYKDCPAKYRYSYIEKLPKKDWDFHTFGKFLHEVLENFYKQRIQGITDSHNIIMGNCLKLAYQNWKAKLTLAQFQEAKAILSSYLKKIAILGDKAPQVVNAEKPFWIDIDGKILLNGYIDRTQIDHDGIIHVSDYKTSKSKKYLKNDFFQLMTYAFVMCLEDPSIEKIRTSYIMLKHDCDSIVKEFTRKEVMKIEDIYLDWANKISEEKLFRANPTPLCEYCDAYDVCPSAFISNKNDPRKVGEVKW